jgi:hypothetical protein
MEQEKVPDPSNDKAMSELHDFVSKWVERHGLQGAKEYYYLGLYLTGRLNVNVKMENLKKLYAEDERDEIGLPIHPKPVDYAARCEELISHYEAMYCKCANPATDSYKLGDDICDTCGKPVRRNE